jgi:hypothetical protein
MTQTVIENEEMENLIHQIICNPFLHAMWLNTLSYLENCGARKIAQCEHPTKVKEEMLKHAAEEFRHAYYLKQQISKVYDHPLDTYELKSLLGGFESLHYLHALDNITSRFLIKEKGIKGSELKKYSYLLVTYAIELRAAALYPLYHKILKKLDSKVHVKAIVLEEEEHLNEMREELNLAKNGMEFADTVCEIESQIFQKWISALKTDVYSKI